MPLFGKVTASEGTGAREATVQVSQVQRESGRTGGPGTQCEVDERDDARDGDLIVGDVLVEDVSIDGMCGVY